MEKLALPQGAISSTFNLSPATKHFTNVPIAADKKGEVALNQTPPKKKETHNVRKAIDIATISLYVGIIATALYMTFTKGKHTKLVEKNMAAAKRTSSINKNSDLILKAEEDKTIKLPFVQRFFKKMAEYKSDSEELTNNMVYGFGTLVVMPLIILFSPIGKKQATKEDRTFTVLRQPVSFATVFALQSTFDKIFKSLIKDVNKYNLLDKGVKGADGKQLIFQNDKVMEMIKASIPKDKKFKLNPESLNDSSLYADLEAFKSKIGHSGSLAGKELDAEQLFGLIKTTLGEEPDVGGTKLGKLLGKKAEYAMPEVKGMLAHLKDEMPELVKNLKESVNVTRRCKMLNQSTLIIANVLFSQALGIMTLNVIYGKFMKKYQAWKVSIQQGGTEPKLPQPQAKGEVK